MSTLCRESETRASAVVRTRRVLAEVVLIGVLYVAYSCSRLLASDALAPALDRAAELEIGRAHV